MNVLSIESASDYFSVSLLYNNEIETIEATEQRSASEKCAEYVETVLNRNKLSVADLHYICINKGPGSFTGLRVGLSFAQGLAFPNQIPVIGLDAFELLFFKTENKNVIGVIESKRDEVYLLENNLEIEKIKKAKLSDRIDEKKIVTNDMKDLAIYLPKNQIEVQACKSKDLIELFLKKKSEHKIKEEDQIQLLYLNTFKPK